MFLGYKSIFFPKYLGLYIFFPIFARNLRIFKKQEYETKF